MRPPRGIALARGWSGALARRSGALAAELALVWQSGARSGDERVAARRHWEGVTPRVGAVARCGLARSASVGVRRGSRSALAHLGTELLCQGSLTGGGEEPAEEGTASPEEGSMNRSGSSMAGWHLSLRPRAMAGGARRQG